MPISDDLPFASSTTMRSAFFHGCQTVRDNQGWCGLRSVGPRRPAPTVRFRRPRRWSLRSNSSTAASRKMGRGDGDYVAFGRPTASPTLAQVAIVAVGLSAVMNPCAAAASAAGG